MDPPGSTRWVVIPTALRGRRHELPLTVFRVARDVIEDTTWQSQGLDAVRSEILDRLYDDPNCLSDPDLISVAFLADLRSSLHHRHYSLRPWSYPKWEDEPESSTDPSSSSDDSPSGPDTRRQDRNETVPETRHQQNSSNKGEDDSASQTSEPSFRSAQESDNPDGSGSDEDSDNPASTRSPNTLQTASQGIPSSIASSDSDVSHRHYKFLVATWKYLGLQLELLQSLFASRKHSNAKTVQENPLVLAQPQPARCETSQVDKQARTQSPAYKPNASKGREQGPQAQTQPLSELRSRSQVYDTPCNQQYRSDSEEGSLFGDIPDRE
jgi:hypothetical protein